MMGFYQKPEAVPSSCKYRVGVLVCTPSNSAFDEIVLRVLNGGIKFLQCIYLGKGVFLYALHSLAMIFSLLVFCLGWGLRSQLGHVH